MTMFTENVETVLKFKIAVRDLFLVSESMPLEYCNNVNSTITNDDEEVEATRVPEVLEVNVTSPKKNV